MVSVDYSVILQIINFILLVWLMNVVLYKPIRGMLAQRKDNIGAMQQDISSSRDGAAEKEAAFETGVRAARAKGVEIKDSLLEEASNEERRIIGEISAKAQADLSAVRTRIASEVGSVREALQKEVDTFAEEITEKVLGRAL